MTTNQGKQVSNRRLPHHVQDFKDSGLTDATIEVAGFFSVSRVDARKKILGFDPKSDGWAIKYPSRMGIPDLYEFKCDVPLEGPDGKTRKYLHPLGSQNKMYIPQPPIIPSLIYQRPTFPLYITEGVKKALAAAQVGLACVALPGVWGWKFRDEKDDSRVIKNLTDVWLKGRKIYICYDSDLAEKKEVALAEKALAEKLYILGASEVHGVRLPDGEGD